jgi:hypothetical protein
MMKQLTLAAVLVLAVACKTEASSPASAPAGGAEPASKARSAKIDIKPVQPAPPANPDDEPRLTTDDPTLRNPAARGEWRKRREAKLDTNGDGVISEDERTAAMRERITDMRTRLDSNSDGKLSPAELTSAPGRMRFDNPAAVDANNDGDISADELAAAMKARREQRRAARGGSDQDTP